MLLFLTINNIFVQILYAMSEKELIILLKNGDEKAFTTLYRLYWSKVYNFSRLYLSSITEVEEVVQEYMKTDEYPRLLIAYIEKAAKFADGASMTIYINQIGRAHV